MPSTYSHLRIHFVWSTQYRAATIPEASESDLYEYIGGILRKRNHKLIAAGGTADHIHLLVGQHPTESVSDLARDIKTNTSAWFHTEFKNMKDFAWQTGYGAFSVRTGATITVGL